jgi:hypothetical protein
MIGSPVTTPFPRQLTYHPKTETETETLDSLGRRCSALALRT